MVPAIVRSGAITVGLVLALAGCKKAEVDEKHADPGTVASKVAEAAPRPQAGRWETVIKLESMDMPGMPPQARAMMEKQMGAGRTIATCLTPEEANQPSADFFNRGKADCSYDNFTMADGRMEATMTCKQGPGVIKVAMSGQYAADSYEVHTESRFSGGGGPEMTQKMTMTAHRTGDCRGDEIGAKRPG